eukprot:scaffold50728_cov14-Tisochrysis_lutea.AAC.1
MVPFTPSVFAHFPCTICFSQCDVMTNKHFVFMTKDGRISLAGLNSAKVVKVQAGQGPEVMSSKETQKKQIDASLGKPEQRSGFGRKPGGVQGSIPTLPCLSPEATPGRPNMHRVSLDFS